jgi:hypothetical protein
MTDTANLGLPLIEGAQAQKHVTHNEALRILDTLVQLAVADRDLATPPGSPAEGQRWLVAASPTGAWTGHATHIAFWQDGAWQFSVPKVGWLVYVADEGALIAWTGSVWVDAITALTSLNNMVLLGVGTTADATNPFSAKLNNALWTAKTVAAGGDGNLRYKMSKEAGANTLSLLLQDNFSGRAEIGLTGDDNLHVKVSADGTTWREALVVDRATGKVAFSQGLADSTAIARTRLVLNSDHIVSQENGDTAVTGLGSSGGTDTYITDQWTVRAKGSLRASAQRISSLSLPGIKYALRTTVTTAQSVLGTGDYLQMAQPVEGWRCASLGLGAGGASPLSLGVYVRASVAGTYCVFLTNAARNRSIVKSFSYAAANTWQWVAFSGTDAFAGDTAGTWLTDSGVGLRIGLSLAAGTALQGTVNAWSGAEVTATSAQTNLAATASATFDMTALCAFGGVNAPAADQVPFVLASFEEEIARCERYLEYSTTRAFCFTGSVINGGGYDTTSNFRTRKRTIPTMTYIEVSNGSFPSGSFTTSNVDTVGVTVEKVANATSGGGYYIAGYKADARM